MLLLMETYHGLCFATHSVNDLRQLLVPMTVLEWVCIALEAIKCSVRDVNLDTCIYETVYAGTSVVWHKTRQIIL